MGRIIHSKFRLFLVFIVIIILSVFVLPILSNIVKAESQTEDLSWTSAKPVIYSSYLVPEKPSSLCSSTYQKKEIAGESVSRDVCVMAGDSVQFGVYFLGGGAFIPTVSFKYDSKMYRVNGVCGQYDSCLYLPENDTLVTKQHLINGFVRSLVVYKNFTQRLTPVVRGIIPLLSYDFDSSNPDYIFKSADGYAWPIGGFGASDNGQWLAIEFRQRGIGLLNIESLQMKRLSTMVYSYGMAYDPTSELAVSNDGVHIAIMGNNAGVTVFDNPSTCGDLATDENMSWVSQIAVRCPTASINPGDLIYHFANAFKPNFNNDADELDLYAVSFVGELRKVSLRVEGYQTQRLDYLALGDSFSSGEGELDDSYYLGGTNDGFEKCHTSTRSYPYIVANLLDINPNYMKSVACSGAKTVDVVGKDSFYLGQGDRLGQNGLNLSNVDRVSAQTLAKEYFLPGRIYQESFVSKYKPSVITVGIGGNDAGLMQKLTACLGPDTCDWAGTAEGREKSAIEIKNLFGKLVQTYQSLHTASPRTKIYAIGYPNIIDPIGQCSLLASFLLSDSEKQFISQGVIYLNQVIEAAAGAAGIKYIDIQASYGDNVICGSASPSAMNLIEFGDDFSPISFLDWMKVIGQESFHPNYLGHVFAADSIINSVSNIMAYDYCGGVTICPNGNLAPEPSSYWVPDQYHNYPIAKISDYVFDRDGATDNRQKKLVVVGNSLEPGSTAIVEITSNPRSLGQFEVGSDGGLVVDVDLPIDLEEGYHTVHLYGTSFSGEPIELYQIIEFRIPNIALDDQPVVNDGTNDDSGSTDNTNINDETGGAVDVYEDDNSNNQDDLIDVATEQVAVPLTNIGVKLWADTSDDIAVFDNLNNINEAEQPDESIAMVGEQTVKGDLTAQKNPIVQANLVIAEKDGRLSIYLAIVVFCMIMIVVAKLLIHKFKTR